MGKPLPKPVLEWLEKNIWKYPNVRGFSRSFKKKIVGGEETEIECVRIYVSKKVPRSHLLDEEVIPLTIEDIPTDVVEKGIPRALPNPPTRFLGEMDKTGVIRPVKMGVSIGHRNITAGSAGWPYLMGDTVVVGTNAHIVSPHPNRSPERIRERRILQPGPHHLEGRELDPDDSKYVVGRMVWYKRIKPVYEPSACGVASAISYVYNKVAELLGARTRLVPLVEEVNHIDWGCYLPTKPHDYSYPTIDVEGAKLIGHLFAGSKYIGIVCKAKYILEEGYRPAGVDTYEPKLFDGVFGESFWCHYETKVIDESAEVEVGYGDFTARFRDVIFLDNDPPGTIKGGWSGSAFWFRGEEDGS